jgi:hypothetical protein
MGRTLQMDFLTIRANSFVGNRRLRPRRTFLGWFNGENRSAILTQIDQLSGYVRHNDLLTPNQHVKRLHGE